jgi:hypothetical protein
MPWKEGRKEGKKEGRKEGELYRDSEVVCVLLSPLGFFIRGRLDKGENVGEREM